MLGRNLADLFTKAVYAAQGSVFGEGVPGGEHQVFTDLAPGIRIHIWPGGVQDQGGNRHKGESGLVPG